MHQASLVSGGHYALRNPTSTRSYSSVSCTPVDARHSFQFSVHRHQQHGPQVNRTNPDIPSPRHRKPRPQLVPLEEGHYSPMGKRYIYPSRPHTLSLTPGSCAGVFGGLVISHAMVAATKSVKPEFHLHVRHDAGPEDFAC